MDRHLCHNYHNTTRFHLCSILFRASILHDDYDDDDDDDDGDDDDEDIDDEEEEGGEEEEDNNNIQRNYDNCDE